MAGGIPSSKELVAHVPFAGRVRLYGSPSSVQWASGVAWRRRFDSLHERYCAGIGKRCDHVLRARTNRINSITAVSAANGNREVHSFGKGKLKRIAWEMPHIARGREVQGSRNSNLGATTECETGTKKQVARIFDKNSYRYIFSS